MENFSNVDFYTSEILIADKQLDLSKMKTTTTAPSNLPETEEDYLSLVWKNTKSIGATKVMAKNKVPLPGSTIITK